MGEYSKKLNIKKKIDLLLYKLGLKPLSIETLKELKESKKEEETPEFYDVYFEPEEEFTDIEKYEFILYEEDIVGKTAKSLSKIFKGNLFPSRNELRYMGIRDEVAYFKKVITYMIITFLVLLFMGILDNDPLQGLANGLLGAGIILALSLFYPKIRLILFKGEIKLQILFTLIYMVSILRAGGSLPEVLDNISKSREYGVVAFEARSIIRDVNIGGYNLVEALERAKMRTKIPLLKKLYDQMIIGYNKGNLPLLLEKLYEDIVRESMIKLDSSKFMIQNLGNLAFGVGLILPFTGMILSTMISNQGFSGILSTINLLLLKIGPLLTLIFGIFVKLKIE
ncbi:Type II secretion system F domain protein [Methanocaldococcus sp. FS406-22]|uniref:type II secretion system F family protein n=1 Tax=Methanocaldococcus sp. (strain FS406-22) TaxID=644281 RepID=UPI0001BF437E|nr:type II secretion system F family protein [Methanocaldococcus sp. FS406-22]ADC70072.1 Type II secretion system F domain protein [Methanocaldococcus sp. FS406-22]